MNNIITFPLHPHCTFPLEMGKQGSGPTLCTSHWANTPTTVYTQTTGPLSLTHYNGQQVPQISGKPVSSLTPEAPSPGESAKTDWKRAVGIQNSCSATDLWPFMMPGVSLVQPLHSHLHTMFPSLICGALLTPREVHTWASSNSSWTKRVMLGWQQSFFLLPSFDQPKELRHRQSSS